MYNPFCSVDLLGGRATNILFLVPPSTSIFKLDWTCTSSPSHGEVNLYRAKILESFRAQCAKLLTRIWACAHARVELSPTHRGSPRDFSNIMNIMKTSLVLFAALVLRLAAAKFEFTEEWELWKKVR